MSSTTESTTPNVEPVDLNKLMVAKVVAMLVLGVISGVMGFLPIIVTRCLQRRGKETGLDSEGKAHVILGLLLSFGGGALLCTTFLHMLPEIRETITELQEEGRMPETPFPLPEMIMCCGFFAMYLVEELVHLYLHQRKRRKCSQEPELRAIENGSVKSYNACFGNPTFIEDDSCCRTADSSFAKKDEAKDASWSEQHDGTKYQATPKSWEPVKVTGHEDHEHMHVPTDMVVASLRGLLVVLALSVHELFEGLAVGLESTEEHTYYMTGAVASHKLVLAFCVGVELVSAGTRLSLAAPYLLTFAAVSPVGIGVGMALLRGEADATVAGGPPNAVLQGLASGTLLYVVFFEVLARQRGTRVLGVVKLLAVMVGFGFMAGMLSIADHQHGHSHED